MALSSVRIAFARANQSYGAFAVGVAGDGVGGVAFFFGAVPAPAGTMKVAPHSPQRTRCPRTVSGMRSVARQVKRGQRMVIVMAAEFPGSAAVVDAPLGTIGV